MNYTYDPKEDVSQHRTQEIIFKYFSSHPPRYCTVVDVGAFGRYLSNSYALLKAGWHGLLIEPNQERHAIIHSEFSGLNYKLIDVSISDHKGVGELFMHKTPGYDSLLPDWHPNDKRGFSTLTPLATLTDICFLNSIPTDFDLLSVDTEGHDFKIFEKFFNDAYYRPTMIITEADSYPKESALFHSHSYILHAVAGNAQNGNLVYVKNH